jgi:hypothetical protein
MSEKNRIKNVMELSGLYFKPPVSGNRKFTIPTLIIGLGGTGSRVVKSFCDKMEYSYSDSSCVKTIAIDTSREELDSLPDNTQKIFFGLDDLAQIITDISASTHSCESVWFPSEHYNHTLASGTKGAGQVRPIGRLMFAKNARKIYEGIKSAVLKVQEKRTDPMVSGDLRVIVVCSVAGGTGSGTFLDTGYLIREVLSNLPVKNNNLMGFLLLPSVFTNTVLKDFSEQQRVSANGYAALKELDYFNSDNHNPFEVHIPEPA